jgi:hypothetical protein
VADEAAGRPGLELDTTVSHSARIWNYWLGGKDNYAVDRQPGAGSSGFHVADELVFQSVPGSVRGSPNRGITLASKPVTAVIRSPAIVTTSSP